MPDRYHIKTVETPGRFYRVGKFGEVDWREDCSRCFDCVKLKCCFDVYKHETEHNRDPRTATQPLYECKACMSCVQGCTKGLLTLSVNPEYLDMGDAYWKPDILSTTWTQADTGKVPVSGAGYRGPFHGFGFDSIWTDMSEIVRPTRDGIHGREYISTSVDVGPKPMRLHFSLDGKPVRSSLRVLELPIPIILDVPAWAVRHPAMAEARARAAKELGTVASVYIEDALKLPKELLASVAPLLDGKDIAKGGKKLEAVLKAAKLAEIIVHGRGEGKDGEELAKALEGLRKANPQTIPAARLTLVPGIAGRIIEMSGKLGVKVFHLCADLHGCEVLEGGASGRHIKDALRELHGALVTAGVRDELTLIVSGGVALAEHMAKTIICGADVVGAGISLLVALGCRVCAGAHRLTVHGEARGEASLCSNCPMDDSLADVSHAARRLVNLMGAWHSQLLEVLGAMGIREVRRLRGEVGRAIFMEEIEKDVFGDLMQVAG